MTAEAPVATEAAVAAEAHLASRAMPLAIGAIGTFSRVRPVHHRPIHHRPIVTGGRRRRWRRRRRCAGLGRGGRSAGRWRDGRLLRESDAGERGKGNA